MKDSWINEENGETTIPEKEVPGDRQTKPPGFKLLGCGILEWGIVAAVALILLIMLVPMVQRLRNMGARMNCQKNMKTLGELLTSITDARLKPKNDKLREDFFIDLVFHNLHDSPEVLICPATTDEVDEAWYTASKTPLYKTLPRNCSYFGPVDTQAHSIILNADSDEPIAGEHYLNHADGVNILFGDTHVNFYEWADIGDGDAFNIFDDEECKKRDEYWEPSYIIGSWDDE